MCERRTGSRRAQVSRHHLPLPCHYHPPPSCSFLLVCGAHKDVTSWQSAEKVTRPREVPVEMLLATVLARCNGFDAFRRPDVGSVSAGRLRLRSHADGRSSVAIPSWRSAYAASALEMVESSAMASK
eukprot:5633359-Pleurochrysis_carterae.AAC.1